MFYNNELTYITTIVKNKKNYDWFEKIYDVYGRVKKDNLKIILKNFKTDFTSQGIVFLKGTYEGGHDEGGWNGFEWLNKNKQVIQDVSFKPKSWLSLNKVYKCEDDLKIDLFKNVENHDIYEMSENNIYDILTMTGAIAKYYSFAFEGHVSGSTLLDVHTGQYKTEGEESYEQYEDHTEEGNIYE